MNDLKSVLVPLMGAMLILGQVTAPALAQQTGGGGSGSKSDSTAVSLLNGSTATFDWNGQFSLSAPNIHFGGSSSSRGSGLPPAPPPPPPPPEVDLNQLAMELFQTRASGCLTGADTAPCQPATAPPGSFNVRTTEANVRWLVGQAATNALRDMPLPGIVIQTNPTEGIAQMDSWFWVDRSTYDGQPYSQAARLLEPWSLDWDYFVHHHDAVHGPCPGDPSQSCVVGFNDWDETRQGHQDHLDVVVATVTLSPARYAWDFGDDVGGPFRPDSHAQFPDAAGIGQPYTDPYTASPVLHKYQQSSLKFFDQGGFDVHLNVRWTASALVTVTTDGTLIETGEPALPDRFGDYDALVQVRESQPVLVAGSP